MKAYFRFSLRTFCILMLVASILIWANLKLRLSTVIIIDTVAVSALGCYIAYAHSKTHPPTDKPTGLHEALGEFVVYAAILIAFGVFLYFVRQ